MAKKLYVGNISWGTTNDSLKAAFEAFGPVEEAFIITDKFSGRSKGFGFVTFVNEEDGDKAISEMNGKELDGRELIVNEARPQEQRPPRGDY